jgi:predicted O-linked N-acetylglucosamine transferase (SPINDLY family)
MLLPEPAVRDHLAVYALVDVALDPFPHNRTP